MSTRCVVLGALLAMLGTCSSSLADTSLAKTYFKWSEVGTTTGCKILGANEFNGPIILGKKTKYVVAIGARKFCPREITVKSNVLKVRRYDAFTAERFQFKAYNENAYRLVWRVSPGKYQVRVKPAP